MSSPAFAGGADVKADLYPTYCMSTDEISFPYSASLWS